MVSFKGYFVGPGNSNDEYAEKLLQSGSDVIWASLRSHPFPTNHPISRVPEKRGITRLTASSVQSLLDDFRERDTHDYARCISLLIGTLPILQCTKGPAFLQQALQNFFESKDSVIHLLLFQLGDTPQEVFVSNEMDKNTRRTMIALGISREHPKEEVKTRKKDYLLETIVSLAFPLKSVRR